jgi:antitoxin component of MazEF toxin-antitoxin module
MTSQIIRVGNALAAEIPEESLEMTGFSVGETVEWVVTDRGGLALVPSEPPIADAALDFDLLKDIPGAGDEAAIVAHIQAGLADFAAGRFVSHDRVVAWLESWGTENELPA